MSSPQLDIAADDDPNSNSVKGTMSAIHALMTISEPMGFNDKSTRDSGDGLDSTTSRNRNFDWDNMNPARNPPTSTTILNGVVPESFVVADNVGGGPIVCQECPTIGHENTAEFNDPYFLFKTVHDINYTGARVRVRESCRHEGCNEEVATVSLDDKFHVRNNESDEKIYNHSGFCKKHLLGSKKCEFLGCDKCAQGSTKFCIKHGGTYLFIEMLTERIRRS